jgi:hypothetical protein
MNIKSVDNLFDTSDMILESKISLSVFGKSSTESTGTITLSGNKIKEFSFKSKETQIQATCTSLS